MRTEVPPLPPLPSPLVHAPRRRSGFAWVVLVIVLALVAGGAVAAFRFGLIPGVLPPRAPTSAPAVVSPPASSVTATASAPMAAPILVPVDAAADVVDDVASADAAAATDDVLDAGADVSDGGRIEGDAGWYFENGFWHPPPRWKAPRGVTTGPRGPRPIDPDDPYGTKP